MVSPSTPPTVWDTSSVSLRAEYVRSILNNNNLCGVNTEFSENYISTEANLVWSELTHSFRRQFKEFIEHHMNSDEYKQWLVSVRKTQELNR